MQQEETHVHIYEETDGMPKKKIYDISRLHGIKKFIFISIFAVVTIIRICSYGFFCYPQSDCWTDEEISGLVFCSYRKYGYKWTYGRYDSMAIHHYPYYHTWYSLSALRIYGNRIRILWTVFEYVIGQLILSAYRMPVRIYDKMGEKGGEGISII